MKIVEKIEQMYYNRQTQKELNDSNHPDIVESFMLGSGLTHRTFRNYVYLENLPDIKTALFKRNFEDLSDVNMCKHPLISLGTPFYNHNFNMVFVLIDSDKWKKVNIAITIAEKSSEDFKTQIKIITNTVENI